MNTKSIWKIFMYIYTIKIQPKTGRTLILSGGLPGPKMIILTWASDSPLSLIALNFYTLNLLKFNAWHFNVPDRVVDWNKSLCWLLTCSSNDAMSTIRNPPLPSSMGLFSHHQRILGLGTPSASQRTSKPSWLGLFSTWSEGTVWTVGRRGANHVFD